MKTHENNIDIIIPNTEIVSKVVYNFTKMPQMINSVPVSISANNNIDYIKLIENIKTVLKTNCKYIINKNNIMVDISDIAESGTKIDIRFEINSVDSTVERLANGQYLVTATIHIGYLNPSNFSIATGNRGYDLSDAPKSITTRILLNSGKTQIIAQAAQALEK